MSDGPARGHTPRVWQERADRVRRDVAALAATGMGVADLYTAAIRRIGEVVRADLTCWFEPILNHHRQRRTGLNDGQT